MTDENLLFLSRYLFFLLYNEWQKVILATSSSSRRIPSRERTAPSAPKSAKRFEEEKEGIVRFLLVI